MNAAESGTDKENRGNYRWIVLGVVLLADLAFGTTATILGASLGTVEIIGSDPGSSPIR